MDDKDHLFPRRYLKGALSTVGLRNFLVEIMAGIQPCRLVAEAMDVMLKSTNDHHHTICRMPCNAILQALHRIVDSSVVSYIDFRKRLAACRSANMLREILHDRGELIVRTCDVKLQERSRFPFQY